MSDERHAKKLADKVMRYARELIAAEARIKVLESERDEARDVARQAVDVIESVQNYKQPDDPWEENALTMCEHEVYDFDVNAARIAVRKVEVKE